MKKRKEEWRELDWCPYMVSNMGRIARIRDLRPLWNGYIRAQVSDHQERKVPRYAHQLVAEAFLGPRPVGCEIHHKDGNKANNRADNLEYLTKRGHVLAGLHQVNRGEKHWRCRLNAGAVREIRRRYAAGERQRAIAKDYGIFQGTVSSIVRRETWRHIE